MDAADIVTMGTLSQMLSMMYSCWNAVQGPFKSPHEIVMSPAKCMQHQPMFSIYLCYVLTGWGACWWCAEGTWGAFLISSSRLSQPWGHACTGWLSLQQNGVSVRCYAGTSSLPPVSWDNRTHQNRLNSTSVALNRKYLAFAIKIPSGIAAYYSRKGRQTIAKQGPILCKGMVGHQATFLHPEINSIVYV